MQASFSQLIAEAESAPIVGWDFTWLDRRATEDRPTWHDSETIAERYKNAHRVLDLQSGGGELLSHLTHLPPVLIATEGYFPNLVVAAGRLQPRGAFVVSTDRCELPFVDQAFDLVTSRHPVETWWDEIARVLRPGGIYLSQQVGPDSVRELSEFILTSTNMSIAPREPACRLSRCTISSLGGDGLWLEPDGTLRPEASSPTRRRRVF